MNRIPLPEIPGLTLIEWPEEPAIRRNLTVAANALGHRDTIARWAHARATPEGADGPGLIAWSAMLGVSRATLARWRSDDPEGLGALPVAARGDPARFAKP